MTDTWHETPTEKEQLEYKIHKLEQENARLREALELIAKAKFYFARDEDKEQIGRIYKIAKDALKGGEE